MMMIFIDSNWVSTRWQWSVDLCKNGKETAQKEKQYKYTEHKMENKNTKQEKTYKEFKKNTRRVIWK